MTTLYYSPGTASFVVHWLLIELAVPHRLHRVDLERLEQKSPEYLRINPAGAVPAIDLGGVIVTEAAAIVMHLADAHPGAALAPKPGLPSRAQYYRWMFFLANTLQPAFRAWFYPREPAGEANIYAVKSEARIRIDRAWRLVDEALQANGPYLLGGSPSAADFMLTMLMRWSRNMPRPADYWPALALHAQRMKALDSFRETYAREGLTDWT